MLPYAMSRTIPIVVVYGRHNILRLHRDWFPLSQLLFYFDGKSLPKSLHQTIVSLKQERPALVKRSFDEVILVNFYHYISPTWVRLCHVRAYFFYYPILFWVNIPIIFLGDAGDLRYISTTKTSDKICARFKQMQRLGRTQFKAEVLNLLRHWWGREQTSALNCVHPSRCESCTYIAEDITKWCPSITWPSCVTCLCTWPITNTNATISELIVDRKRSTS